nr:argonaute-binding protein 1 [Quercus suber]
MSERPQHRGLAVGTLPNPGTKCVYDKFERKHVTSRCSRKVLPLHEAAFLSTRRKRSFYRRTQPSSDITIRSMNYYDLRCLRHKPRTQILVDDQVKEVSSLASSSSLAIPPFLTVLPSQNNHFQHPIMDPPLPTISTWQDPNGPTDPHEQAEEIVRQVEYYFGDENLPGDAHLLALSGGDGNGPVHRRDVLSFNKMKAFRPWTAVRAALEQSKQLEIVNGQFIKRRSPLIVPLRVSPKAMPERTRKGLAVQDPTYSKNMLKPTGFEPSAPQGPITPAEYEGDRRAFDPQESFIFRMENAVNRYNARRKMHQETLQVFHKFVNFGGFEGGRQFTGGTTKKQMVREGLDEDEIERMTAYFGVNAAVRDEFIEDEDETDEEKMESMWVVDFPGVVKAFLSGQFMTYWDWYREENITLVANVLRNFYGYLLLHDVCPEYEPDILQAQDVCDVAREEFPLLAHVDQQLPGSFSIACSTLYRGHFANLHRPTDLDSAWVHSGENMGLSQKDAHLIFMAAMTVYGSSEQREHLKDYEQFKIISSDEVGLEVAKIQRISGAARDFYDNPKLKDTIIRPMGKLVCKRWRIPDHAPRDLPKWKVDLDREVEKSGEMLEFLMDDEILKHCYPGFKIAAIVNRLDSGITWIDRVDHTFPSFFTWLPNEMVADYKNPGPPKAWMVAANMRAAGISDAEPSDIAGQRQRDEAESIADDDEGSE